MDNIGGIRRLWALNPDSYVSNSIGEDGVHTLSLVNEPDTDAIDISDETGRLTLQEQETDGGTIYGFEFVGRLPGAQANAYADLKAILERKQIIIAEDNNGVFWCAGVGASIAGAYFSLVKTRNTGTIIQDLHSVSIQVSAQLPSPVIPCNDPFS